MKREKDKTKAKKKLGKKRAEQKSVKPDVDRTFIETIEKSCPLCKIDVKGSDKRGFYCPKCNMIYKREHLGLVAIEEDGKDSSAQENDEFSDGNI